jgi:hypothetical protein
LESADSIETKAVSACRFRIVWDHLGWFRFQVVPVLFPPINSTDFTRVCKAALALPAILKCPQHSIDGERHFRAMSAMAWRRFECRPFQDGVSMSDRPDIASSHSTSRLPVIRERLLSTLTSRLVVPTIRHLCHNPDPHCFRLPQKFALECAGQERAAQAARMLMGVERIRHLFFSLF